MRVLVLGGTGSIGTSVVGELHRRKHDVSILCRSEASAEKARALGAAVVRGSIEAPKGWIERLSDADAVIHLATGFGPDAGNVDRALLDALFAHAQAGLRLIYTGGVWLYGSGTVDTSPRTRYRPPAAWQWAADGCRRVLEHPGIYGMVVHPANVTDDAAGVPPILLTDAQTAGRVRFPVSIEATWPLVTRSELALVYAEVLENGDAGLQYAGVSEPAVPASELIRRTANATGLPATVTQVSIEEWQREYGDWTSGYGLSQNAAPDQCTSAEGWLDALALPAMIVDAGTTDPVIRFANRAWLSVHGHGDELTTGEQAPTLQSLYREGSDGRLGESVRDVLSHPERYRTVTVEALHTHRSAGRWYRHAICGIAPTFHTAGDNQVLIIEEDITWDVLDESRLAQQASIDPLTGLLSREPFLNELREKLRGLTANQGSLCLVFMDLNKFKPINDTYGHDVGDRVLSQIGERLLGEMSPGNAAGRLGGDEFVLMLTGTLDTGTISDYLHAMRERVFLPVQVTSELTLPVGGSFGYACTQDPHVSVAELLKAADTAMYRAKQNPDAGPIVAGEVIEFREKTANRTELLHALKTDGLEMYLHPIGSVRNGLVVGFEVLPRWQHPDYGLLELEHFHPLLVHSEEGKAFDRWLILTAARLSASFQDRGFNIGIGINLTRRQLDDGSFVDFMRETSPCFADGMVDLTLEIVESPHFRDHDLAFSALQQAREMGAQVVLDHFGGGTSSMEFASRLPLDFIKLHEDLSHDLHKTPGRTRYLQALIAFSHGLGVPVVASGIHSEDDVEVLSTLQCDLIQGKLWSEPLTLAEVEQCFLRDDVQRAFRLRRKKETGAT